MRKSRRRAPSWGAALVVTLAAPAAHARSPVLEGLLTFHPGWITRSMAIQDPTGDHDGGRGQGGGRGGEHRVLFHEMGEGRIVRLWMTPARRQEPGQYEEIWIQIDGQTAFRGSPIEFFQGRGPSGAPLLLDVERSSGALVSYVPFSYSREARILFRGDPGYFRVTYREGRGASAGPTAEELTTFLAEDWTAGAAAPMGAPRPLRAGAALALAAGPATGDRIALRLSARGDTPPSLAGLSVRVGDQPPVPLSFFFGLAGASDGAEGAGWAPLRSAVHAVDPARGMLFGRLPIPLRRGEELKLLAGPGAAPGLEIAWAAEIGAPRPGVRIITQFREQRAGGGEPALTRFEHHGPTALVSLVESISGGRPGDRACAEGGEVVRTDGMAHAVQIGAGAEDDCSGGPQVSPLSGRPRSTRALYRHYVPDPIVGRAGVRLDKEAGPSGGNAPLTVRSLALAYAFDAPVEVGFEERRAPGGELISARDALRFACPPGPPPDGLLLSRARSAEPGGQRAEIRVRGRSAGLFFDAAPGGARLPAQSAAWIDLAPGDCEGGAIAIDVDAPGSPAPSGEIAYEAQLFRGSAPAPGLTQGAAVHVLDTRGLDDPARPDAPRVDFYVNDHAAIQDPQGAWRLFGIFHREPFQGEDEREIMHAACAEADPARWGEGACGLLPGDARIALRADPAAGERVLWAPHVAAAGGSWLMALHTGQRGGDPDRAQIAVARAGDLEGLLRAPRVLSSTDLCVARDPMLRRMAGLWVIYYTRCDDATSRRSGVAYRTSVDGARWSDPAMALVVEDAPPMFNSGYTESPFVFERRGWFYLSVTSYPISHDATLVFRSRSPFHFPGRPIARLRAHAAEWIAAGGDLEGAPLFLSHAGPGQGGVWLSPISGI
ncbi:MAG: hypothetical protein IT372_23875 [Polyangiaceae bacterium]|nr:hypothetical protein [Polyangiaceae bacterium]